MLPMMDKRFDPHLQRIMSDAGFNNSDTQVRGFGPAPNTNSEAQMESHPPTSFTFAPGPRHIIQERTLLHDYSSVPSFMSASSRQQDSTSERSPYDQEYQMSSTMQLDSDGPHRVSLPPRNTFSNHGSNPRVLANADNHFNFAQNLRHRAPVRKPSSKPLSRRFPTYSEDHIDLLAQSMLIQQSMQTQDMNIRERVYSPRNESVFESPPAHPEPSQLQLQKQRLFPPFNLNGYASNSPRNQHAFGSSSSPPGQCSSPTARIVSRRENRPAPSPPYPRDECLCVESIPARSTPNKHMAIDIRTPHTLSNPYGTPMAYGIQLVSPHELPDRFRQVFPYELFNAVQSRCFAPIYRSKDNIVVSSPTGSGKTALLELAICKLVEDRRNEQFKIVYQAPTKSLCSERMRDWQKKFSHLNLPCAELTGDTTHNEMARVRSATIIVTTPEKWDSITRKLEDRHKLSQMVKLFLIDEVHMLKESRGATLEAVVSRMKGGDVRFVALSATVPNSCDIAVWLGKDSTNQHLPAHRETFSEEFRPVKLQKHVKAFDGTPNDYAFDKILDEKLPALIQRYSHKKPIMVFCLTRKSCENTANILAKHWTGQKVVDRAWPAPTQRTAVGHQGLQQLVTCGIAFHHAGLELEDRHAIEMAYLKGDINVICCTSTLAVGVNLPCHLVVLKGTAGFKDGGIICEYSDLDIMQMLGRAGRPQFDDTAVAVIMTRTDKADRYNKMMSGQDTLESTLHLNLIEHLNSEISLGTVTSLQAAKRWIGSTFLSVRMRQNPNHYNMDGVGLGRDADLRLEQICERDIKLLQEQHIVIDTEQQCKCTEYGHAMSRYMVQFETMKLLLSIPSRASKEQILWVLCQAVEFKDLRMKPAERPFLREFNKSPFIKYPINGNITTTAHKVSLTIQVQLGGIDLPTDKDFGVIRRQWQTTKSIIFERIQRLVRCVIDCKTFDCDAVSTRHALDLARSLSAEYWESSNLALRQLPQVGPVALRKLIHGSIKSVEDLMRQDTGTIERVMSKNPPWGKKMKDVAANFPALKVVAGVQGIIPTRDGKDPTVDVKAIISYTNQKVPVWNGWKPSLTFIAETTDGNLVHFWRGNISKLERGLEIKFQVELAGPEQVIKCWISCEQIVGTIRSCVLQHDIPASAFPPRQKVKDAGPKETKYPTRRLESLEDEFGDGALDDQDMLDVMKSVEKDDSNYGSDEFIDIDDFDRIAGPARPKQVEDKIQKPEGSNNAKKAKEEAEDLVPYQMANGKWTCNHHCRDNQLLKNGKPCRHRCCKEGHDKPIKKSKSKRKASRDGIVDEKNGGRMKPKLKSETYREPDPQNVVLIDLTKELPQMPYLDLAPRHHGKLHKLHKSVQDDRRMDLPKQTPTLDYSWKELPASQTTDPVKYVPGDSDEEIEFPSPGALMRGSVPFASSVPAPSDPYGDLFEVNSTIHEDNTSPLERTSSLPDNLGNVEKGLLDFNDSTSMHESAPTLESSFANKVFDFNAFNYEAEGCEEIDDASMIELSKLQNVSKTPPQTLSTPEISLKRERSEEMKSPAMKHRRVSKTEEHSRTAHALPEWVNDLDPEFVDSLLGYVDFVD